MYGDGLFETIIYKDGELKFEQFHKDRLTSGMSAMNLSFPKDSTIDTNFNNIHKLVKKQDVESARLRLQVWRSSGGLYTPAQTTSNVLVTSKAFNKNVNSPKSIVSFSNAVTLNKTKWSAFKTISAIPYIQAGLERAQRKLDDLILLDHHDYISECTSSNLFWKKEDTYFTPSLDTGCIDGIMRRHIIESLRQQQIAIQIGEYHQEKLLEADEAFTTNVTGIQPISAIDDTKFSNYSSIIPLLGL
jgi:branched-chain amino acid aminotransferase/4-amino-4-deoxychorismate lyase